MNYKKIKSNAKNNLKHNYFKNVIVVFVCTILIYGGINYSTKNILKVDITNKENIEVINNYKNKSNSEILDNLYSKIDLNIKKIICIILIMFFMIDFSYLTFVKPNTGKGITTEVIN